MQRKSSFWNWVSLARRIYKMPINWINKTSYISGRLVAEHSGIVITVFLIASISFSIGMLHLVDTTDEIAFLEKDSIYMRNYKQFQVNFQASKTQFYPHQAIESNISRFVIATVAPHNYSKILVDSEFKQYVLNICNTFMNFSVHEITTKSQCPKLKGECYEPSFCVSIRNNFVIKPADLKFSMFMNPTIRNGTVYSIEGIIGTWYLFSEIKFFEQKLLNEIRQMVADSSNQKLRTFFTSTATQSEELKSVIKKDLPKFVITIAMMIIFSVAVTSQYNWIASRAILSCGGVLTTVLAIGSCLGFIGWIGIPFMQLSVLAPFVMIGIGIDNVFVIMTAWTNFNEIDDPVERIGRTQQHCISSILISNLTALLAFIAGTFTPYHGINYTSTYLALMVLFMFIYMSLLFPAFLTLHNQRILSNKHCIFFWRSSTHNERSGQNKHVDYSVFEKIVKYILPSLVMARPIKPLVYMSSGIFTIVGIYKIVHMESYSDVLWFLPAESPVVDFILENRRLLKIDKIVPFVISSPANYWDKNFQGNISNLKKELVNSGHFIDRMEGLSWLFQFTQYCNANKLPIQNSVSFIQHLLRFLEFAKMFQQDIIFSEDNTSIIQSRLYLKQKFFEGTLQTIKAETYFIDVGKILDKYKKNYNINTHIVSLDELSWLRTLHISSHIWSSMKYAILSCCIVVLITIPDIIVYICVVLTTAMTMVSVLGFMGLWNLTYSMSTYIEVMLCIGLCIDYISHIGSAFLKEKGSPSERSKSTLDKVGVALTLAALSSIVGILMLATANSYALQTLFRAMLIVFTFSYFYGVIFLPLLLSDLTFVH